MLHLRDSAHGDSARHQSWGAPTQWRRAADLDLSGGALRADDAHGDWKLGSGRCSVGKRQKGIDIFTVGGDTATVLTQAKLTFDYCKSLGANAVSLNFPFAVSGLKANDPHAIPGVTPSPDLLAQMVPLAAADGLSVQLRPLLDESDLVGGWRGTLAPTDPTTWFANYWSFLEPYLAMAKSSSVGSVYISSELDTMVANYQKKWLKLVADARNVYSGPIYSATSHQAFLPATAVTEAYDDYDPAFVKDTASIATLTT